MKNICTGALALMICVALAGTERLQAQPSTTASSFIIKNAAGEMITLTAPASGVTNYSFTFPSAPPSSVGSLLFGSNTAGATDWLVPGTPGSVLTIGPGGLPQWTSLNLGILDVVGTPNQVNVSKLLGVATLSTPQDIHTDAVPTFDGMTLDNLSGSSSATEIVVSNGGSLETRSISSLPNPGGAEPYVTFGAGSAGLTNNRIATAGTGIDIVDAGVDNGSLTINNTGLLGAAAGTGISVTTTSQTATITNTGVTSISVGAGLSATGSTGAITLNNTGILAINGTPNQVNVSTSSGTATLSTPQNIHTAATPTFAKLTLTNLDASTTGTQILISDGGVLKERPLSSFPTFTGVVTDATLVGDGQTTQLGINLANPNSWSAPQTFAVVDVNGGTIDGTTIGATTQAAGTFTTLGATGSTTLGDGGDNTTINVNGGQLTVAGLTQDNTQPDVLAIDGNGRVYKRAASSLGGGSGWSLTGNAGTTTGTNFLGTTDAEPLQFKIDNNRVMYYQLGDAAGDRAPNLTGGYKTNEIPTTGTDGNVIAGGGGPNVPNTMDDYADYSSILGGALNMVGYSADYVTMGGGYANEVDQEADYSVIAGGQLHFAYDRHTFIGGGYNNSTGIDNGDWTDGAYASVVGGYQNTASGYKSFVGGGLRNTASGNRSAVTGGQDNKATHQEAFVGGGEGNEAKADNAAILGGKSNTVTGTTSSILGGQGLTLSGNRSTGFLAGNTGSNNMSVSADDVFVVGNGDLWMANNKSSAAAIRFYEAESSTGSFPSSTHYSSFEAQNQSSDVRYLLPSDGGSTGEVLGVASVSGTTVTLDWVTNGSGSGAGSSSELFARKSSDQTEDDDDLQDDDHLSLSLDANTTYRVVGVLYVEEEDADKFDFAFDVPNGATLAISYESFENKKEYDADVAAGGRSEDAKGASNGGDDVFGESCKYIKLKNYGNIVRFEGIVETGNSSGDLQVMWCGYGGDDEVKVLKHSYISAIPVD